MWGGLALLVAAVLTTGGGVWLLVQAFREDLAQGLLTLLVPLYAIYYTATRWAATWRATTLYLLGVAAAVVGAVAMGGGLFAMYLGEIEDGGSFTVPGENGEELKFDFESGEEMRFDFDGSGFPEGRGFPDGGTMPNFDAGGSGFIPGGPDDPATQKSAPRTLAVSFDEAIEGSPEREARLRDALAPSPLPDSELVLVDWRGQGLLIRYTGTMWEEGWFLDALQGAGIGDFSWTNELIDDPPTFEAKPQRWELTISLRDGTAGDASRQAAIRGLLAGIDLEDLELQDADAADERLVVRYTGYEWAGLLIVRTLDKSGVPDRGFTKRVVDGPKPPPAAPADADETVAAAARGPVDGDPAGPQSGGADIAENGVPDSAIGDGPARWTADLFFTDAPDPTPGLEARVREALKSVRPSAELMSASAPAGGRKGRLLVRFEGEKADVRKFIAALKTVGLTTALAHFTAVEPGVGDGPARAPEGGFAVFRPADGPPVVGDPRAGERGRAGFPPVDRPGPQGPRPRVATGGWTSCTRTGTAAGWRSPSGPPRRGRATPGS